MKTSNRKESAGIKHTPQRTCVGCRQVKNKREMVRLVRLPDGSVAVDETGKKSGRGAYICPARDCWEKALEGKQLERTLKTTINKDNRNELGIASRSLIKGEI
jgi:predicted RNA-binding protein YlxR (DUF448 family)